MSISRMLKHTIDISRLTAGVGVQKSYQQVDTAVPANVQPMTEEQTALHGLAMGKGWKCFVDTGVTVEAGDKIEWLTKNFRVTGVSEWQNAMSQNAHTMFIMVEEDS